MRNEFSRLTMRLAFARAKGICEGCGLPLQRHKICYDHRIADSHGGSNDLGNCQVLCKLCHDDKTPGDITIAAKIKRVADRDIGIRRRNRIPYRLFDGTPVKPE